MFRALQLIFSPAGTWEKIVKANRSVWATLFLFVLPLLVLTSCIESYALVHWGYQRGQFGQLTRASQSQAVRFGLTQMALDLVIVFLGAQLLRWIIDAPQNRRNFTRCFTTVAYSLSPLFLSHLLDSVPALNTWVGWAIGIALSASALYIAVPRVLQPDQTKAFGVYILTLLELLLLSAIAHLVVISSLHGKMMI